MSSSDSKTRMAGVVPVGVGVSPEVGSMAGKLVKPQLATSAGVEGEARPRQKDGAVTVRLAQSEADIIRMLALGTLLHQESRYRDLSVDNIRLREIGRRGLEQGNPGLLLAERDGELVGMAVVAVGEHFFSAARTATVQLLYVQPKARGGWAAVKLLRALRQWAAAAGARDLHVNVTTGVKTDRTDRMLRRMGFLQTGGNYVIKLEKAS